MADRDSLIELYFNVGFRQRDIKFTLFKNHGIVLSDRHLRRILKRLGLYRRKYTSHVLDVGAFILKKLEGSGKQNGYRWLHRKCLINGFTVSQQTVATMLQFFDAVGVDIRRRRRLRRRQYNSAGPNRMWHLDSYDKIKRYGICINGCVNGFSRRIIWMKAGCTSTAAAVGGYFLDAVKRFEGCPMQVRGDKPSQKCT